MGGVIISDLYKVESSIDWEKLKKGSTTTAMLPLCKLQGWVFENRTHR
ncbi:MAG: hypothetical protein GX330_06140 [Bacteroidales bacterium]|nr:hypothetical protein [Bacteroidales bacterium]